MQIIQIQPEQPCVLGCGNNAAVALMSPPATFYRASPVIPICRECVTKLSDRYAQEVLHVTEEELLTPPPDDVMMARAVEEYRNGNNSIRKMAAALNITVHRAGLLIAAIRIKKLV